MTSLHVICGLGSFNLKSWLRQWQNAWGQGQEPRTQRASVFQKTGSPYIYRVISGAVSKTKKKKVMTLAHFLLIKK